MSTEPSKRPELLDALAFAALSGQHLYCRLATLFLKAEADLKRRSKGSRARRNWEIADKTVGEWMKPIYTPARGTTKAVIAEVVKEALRQKNVREQRAALIAYRATYGKTPGRSERRTAVASLLYGFETKGYNNDYQIQNASPALLTSYGEHLVAVDRGHYRGTHLFVRNRRTGRSTLVKLENGRAGETLPDFFFGLASKETRAAIFEGVSVTVDLDALALIVGGRVETFRLDGKPTITERGTKVVVRTN